MSGDSENPDDLIFDDEQFLSGPEDEEAQDTSGKIEEKVVFSDEAGLQHPDAPAGEPDHADIPAVEFKMRFR